MKHEEKTVKVVKMHHWLVCAYKSEDFAQSQENFARSDDRETVTFRNSDTTCPTEAKVNYSHLILLF